MGIRVNKQTLVQQLEMTGQLDFLDMPYHQAILNDEVPLSIGGGIGQSRTMMMQPNHISEDMYCEALFEMRKKRPNPSLDNLRFVRFEEGLCIQMMHIGPYADEPHTLVRMQGFAEENCYTYHGKHHEIYLGDPRRAKPENLRTVLRHPVKT